VISSGMPFMLGKSRRLARPIPPKPHPGPWSITRVGYQAPEEVVFLDRMPLTATDKIDRVTPKQKAGARLGGEMVV
jgi:hypothetical protein